MNKHIHVTQLQKYRQGSKVIPLKYFPIDFSACTYLPENKLWHFSQAKHSIITMVAKLDKQYNKTVHKIKFCPLSVKIRLVKFVINFENNKFPLMLVKVSRKK